MHGLPVVALAACLLAPVVSRPEDCNANGADDLVELASGGAADCNANGILDECDVLPAALGFEEIGSAATRGGSGSVAAADLDGDGDLDLVTSDSRATGVSTFLNGGDGSSFAVASLPAGGSPLTASAADLDGDGDADIAAILVSETQARLAVLENRGDGTFREERTVAGAPGLLRHVSADLDGDGDVDLAALANSGTREGSRIFTSLNAGDGTFAALRSFTAPVSTGFLLAADFHGDGKPELVTGYLEAAIRIHRLDTRGQLFSFLDRSVGGPPVDAAAVDADGDGDLDLAVATFSTELTVILNEAGSLGFSQAERFGLGETPSRLVAADFDGDGAVDLALSTEENHLLFLPGRIDGRSGIPRRQDLAAAAGATALAGADLDGDAAAELVFLLQSRLAVLRTSPLQRSEDCDANGVPDECDAAREAITCQACALYDCDTPFVLAVGGPPAIRGDPGGRVRVPLVVKLETRDGVAARSGVQSWSLLVGSVGPCRIAEATIRGTAAAEAPEGLRDPEASFSLSGVVVAKNPECAAEAVSAVVLSLRDQSVVLDPASAPHDLLRLTLEASVPTEGPGGCAVRLLERCRGVPEVEPSGGDGSGGDHGFETLLTVEGEAVEPFLRPLSIALVPDPTLFRRGDANTDGRVDISDAVRTFMYLFRGAARPACLDGADSNDDGRIDLSDGITILRDFFRPGTGIPAPGPFDCGPDPTPDRLICEEYGLCE